MNWTDFSTIEEISPAAALVLAAEFDRIRLLTGIPLFTIKPATWNPDVRETLSKLGMFRLLQVPDPTGTPDTQQDFPLVSEAFVARFRSHRDVDGEEADGLLDDLARLIVSATSGRPVQSEGEAPSLPPAARQKLLGMAMLEAIQNTNDHAYPNEIECAFPSVGRWWLTGAFDPDKGVLTLVVHDQGVSIPKTLPRSEFYASIASRFLAMFDGVHDSDDDRQDGKALYSAFEKPRSSTGLDNRGKGLALMREYVERCDWGRLRVISRCGEVVFEKGMPLKHFTHKFSLDGTLVQWEVKV